MNLPLPARVVWTLPLQDAQVLLQLLGQQPTSAGAWPLFVDLNQQTETQIRMAQEPPPVADAPAAHEPAVDEPQAEAA